MTEPVFEKYPLNTIKRLPKRGRYDKDTIYQILDDDFLCHLSWEKDGQPYLIPTSYGRKEDTLYVHGSSKSRMLDDLTDGRPLCMVVTRMDGLVLARSAFHHSMNYRSVVIYGTAREITGQEKMEALKIVSDQIIPGRWEEVRLPNELEMKATTVLAITIDTASAKVRSGPPSDDAEDYNLPVWAGILPGAYTFDKPQPDPALQQELAVPSSVCKKMESVQRKHTKSLDE